MTNPPNIDAIIAELSEAQRDFLCRVVDGQRLKIATREEDRARQSLRRRGLVAVAMNPRRWIANPLGLAVRSALIGEVGRDG